MYKAANSASVADVITRFIMRVMFNTVIVKKKCLRAGTIMLWLHSRAVLSNYTIIWNLNSSSEPICECPSNSNSALYYFGNLIRFLKLSLLTVSLSITASTSSSTFVMHLWILQTFLFFVLLICLPTACKAGLKENRSTCVF